VVFTPLATMVVTQFPLMALEFWLTAKMLSQVDIPDEEESHLGAVESLYC